MHLSGNQRIRAHYEQLSEFEGDRIIRLKEGVGQIGESLVLWVKAMRLLEDDGKNEWTRADFSVMMIADDLGRKQIGRRVDCWNHVDWGRIVFSDESRFHLCLDDHRRHAWGRPGLCADPAFTIARHIGSQQGILVLGVISFEAGPLWWSLETHLHHIAYNTPSWTARSPDPFPIEHVWKMIRRRLHPPGNVDDLNRLEQI
ncbi:transposable element Tc1 transposase [Trichonephila clavipes]|nr:transposable element Tc1 transposase [Trichonephila clavipes]